MIKWLLMLASCLVVISPLSSWEKVLFRKRVPKTLNIKPLRQQSPQRNFLDKHLVSSSFLKVYIDQALVVLRYPTSIDHSLELNINSLNSNPQIDFKERIPGIRSILEDLSNFFDFDFDFGYVGINVTNSEMPKELNFDVLEDPTTSGFEARGTFVSYYEMHPNWSLFGHLSLLEKYTSVNLIKMFEGGTKEIDLDEALLNPFSKTYQQTVKYGMGLRWKKNLRTDRKIIIDAEMLQKADSQWEIEELLLQNPVHNGVQFDSWKFSINLQF